MALSNFSLFFKGAAPTILPTIHTFSSGKWLFPLSLLPSICHMSIKFSEPSFLIMFLFIVTFPEVLSMTSELHRKDLLQKMSSSVYSQLEWKLSHKFPKVHILNINWQIFQRQISQNRKEQKIMKIK